MGTAYSRSVFYIDLLLCATAFFSFVSVERPLGGIGNIRLPAELLLGLLCLLFPFVLWGQRRFRTDLGLIRPNGFWPCELRWWIGAYLLWMWIGVFFSSYPLVAFKAAFTYTACVLPAFYASYKMETETPGGGFGQRVAWAALLGLTCVSLYGIGRYLFGEPIEISKIFRIPQPFLADHTHWGAMLGLWLFPCLYFVRYAARPWQRIAALAMALVFLAALAVSHGRAAAACLSVPVGIAALLYWRRLPCRQRWVTAVVAVALVVAGGWCVVRQGREQAAGKSENWGRNMLSLVQYRQDVSSMERVNRWKCAARLTVDYPWFGCGKDVYSLVYGPYQRPEEMTPISTMDGDFGNAHSEYASAFCETGVPGGLLFLCIVTFGFTAGIKAYRTLGRNAGGGGHEEVRLGGGQEAGKPEGIGTADVRRRRAWILSLLLGLTAYFVQGLFNNFLCLDSGRFSVFLMLALLQAAYVRTLPVRKI